MCGASAGELIVPLYIGKVIDLMEEGDYDTVGELSGYMIIAIVISGLSTGMRAAIFNILSERIARNLRKDFFTSVLAKDIEFYDERRTGEIISRLNSDIQVVQDSLSTNFSMFARAMIQLIAEIFIMLALNPALTGITFAGIVPLALFTWFYQRWMRTLQR